jgi:hypothetical protein
MKPCTEIRHDFHNSMGLVTEGIDICELYTVRERYIGEEKRHNTCILSVREHRRSHAVRTRHRPLEFLLQILWTWRIYCVGPYATWKVRWGMYKMYKLSIVIGTDVLLFTTNNTPVISIRIKQKIAREFVIDTACNRGRTRLTYLLKVWG